MDTKLTIKLDKFVIRLAKEYASAHKRSLSRIIESYLRSLVNQENPEEKEEIRISPFIKSLATGINIPADLDYKKEYLDHISEKYK